MMSQAGVKMTLTDEEKIRVDLIVFGSALWVEDEHGVRRHIELGSAEAEEVRRAMDEAEARG